MKVQSVIKLYNYGLKQLMEWVSQLHANLGGWEVENLFGVPLKLNIWLNHVQTDYISSVK